LKHQPRFQYRQLVPWTIFETSTFTCLCYLFFVFYLSKLSLTHLSASLFRFFGTALSISLLNPLSPFNYDPFDTLRILLDTRYSYRVFVDKSIDSSKQFQVFQVNSSFFAVLFTGKVKFGRETPILQALGPVFASRNCINPFPTGILLYTGFTFDTPEYCPYIYKIDHF
jgi:hypothetical protein